MGGEIVNHAKLSEYYGYAHENVTRVVLRLPGGAEYGAQTFAAWPERIYILGAGGKVLYKGGMGPFDFDPNDAEKALTAAGH